MSGPVAEGERAEILDILRGFALLGIFIANHAKIRQQEIGNDAVHLHENDGHFRRCGTHRALQGHPHYRVVAGILAFETIGTVFGSHGGHQRFNRHVIPGMQGHGDAAHAGFIGIDRAVFIRVVPDHTGDGAAFRRQADVDPSCRAHRVPS